MTRRDKTIARIRNNPTNVSFDKLEALLIAKGFEESRPAGGSSHCTFTKGQFIITVPYARPVKEIYVKKVIELILSSEDQNGKEES